MKVIKYPDNSEWGALLKRPVMNVETLRDTVQKVLEDVKANGDAAVKAYEKQFDKVELEDLAVSEAEMNEAENLVSADLKSALQLAHDNILKFHAAQIFCPKKVEVRPGVTCWQKAVAIEKVGLYVPGGTAPLFSTVLTLILVLFLSPYVANALEEYTPVDDYIESRIVEAFIPDITEEQLSQIDLSGTPFADLTNDQLANLNDLDWDLLGITTDDILNLIGEIPKDMQIQEIENAPMPQFLKDELIENNNSTIYGELGVNSFPRYVAAYISRLVLNLLSFLVTFLLAIIIVKALMFAVNIIGELPVLGLVNHIAGAGLGLVLAVVIVWLGFLIMTLAYTTEVGMACFDMMEKSQILQFLYDTNPLLIRLLGF